MASVVSAPEGPTTSAGGEGAPVGQGRPSSRFLGIGQIDESESSIDISGVESSIDCSILEGDFSAGVLDTVRSALSEGEVVFSEGEM